MAQDRLWQMDLLRRAARGQLAEILGPDAIAIDKQLSRSGIWPRRGARRGSVDRRIAPLLEAYARGVNKFIEQHQNHLPVEFSLLKYKPQPWTPADSFAITAYMYQTLTDTWEDEIESRQSDRPRGRRPR